MKHFINVYIGSYKMFASSFPFEMLFASSFLPVCDVNVDLVFMLDQSGSVGPFNHFIALNFIQDVVSFFNISRNATQVSTSIYLVCWISKEVHNYYVSNKKLNATVT